MPQMDCGLDFFWTSVLLGMGVVAVQHGFTSTVQEEASQALQWAVDLFNIQGSPLGNVEGYILFGWGP